MKNSKQEIWRDIPDYEGYYQVSDEGRVRSLDRTAIDSMGRKYFYKGRIFEGYDTRGYKRVTLSNDDKQEKFFIHQLVAVCFLGHTPDGYTLVIDHINGDKIDNRVKNLRIVTHRNNLSSCFRKDRNILSSKFVGVSYQKNTKKWISFIHHKGKNIYLGLFDNEEKASNMYKKVLTEINNNTFNPEDYEPKFSSKYKGVTFNKASQKWLCQPSINGKQVYLGIHSTEEGAYQTILLHEAIQPIEK